MKRVEGMNHSLAKFLLRAVLLLLPPAVLHAAPPNIVFILADDLGYGDVSCYGARDIKTPNMDKLAMQGVRCTDGYAAFPVCSPSRTAILTGRYPHRFGLTFEDYFGEGAIDLDPQKHLNRPDAQAGRLHHGLFREVECRQYLPLPCQRLRFR
jgi:hypothetical protein